MAIYLKDLGDLFPMLTAGEVLVDSAIFLTPSVLFRTVKQCVLGLSNISTVTSRASVLIYDSRVAQERDLVLVGCKKRHFRRLEAHTELHFLLLLEEFR